MGNENVGSELKKLLDEMGDEFPSDWQKLVEFGELLDGIASLLVKEHRIKISKIRIPTLDEALRNIFENNDKEDYKLAADFAETIMSLLGENEYFQRNFSDNDEEFEAAEEAYIELRELLGKMFVDGC